LVTVPESTLSGDVIYSALQKPNKPPSSGSMPIVLQPCSDKISAAENINIVKKLQDKGCNFLRNNILHGRFIGIINQFSLS
jgi:hypothetical protein